MTRTVVVTKILVSGLPPSATVVDGGVTPSSLPDKEPVEVISVTEPGMPEPCAGGKTAGSASLRVSGGAAGVFGSVASRGNW